MPAKMPAQPIPVEELRAMLERAEKAATGPWYANAGEMETGEFTSSYWMEIGPREGDSADSFAFSHNCGDSIPDEIEDTFAFIAAARTDLPRVIERLLHVESELALLRGWRQC